MAGVIPQSGDAVSTVTDPVYDTVANIQSADGVVLEWCANVSSGCGFFSKLSPAAAREKAAYLTLHANKAEGK